jgi:hypothetical protein
MPPHPKHRFTPNSKECPSCLLVLNQNRCYFPQGTTTALERHGFLPGNIPKNSTHRHRLAEGAVFNDSTLPLELFDHKLIHSLRKNTELLNFTRSPTLSYDDPEDRTCALERARISVSTGLPLGLTLLKEKPSLEERLSNALSAFQNRLDLSDPNGSQLARSSHDNNLTQATAELQMDIKSLITEVQHVLDNPPAKTDVTVTPNISLTETTEEISSLRSELNELRRTQAQTHSSLMTYLEAQFSKINHHLERQKLQRTERSATPTPSYRTTASPPVQPQTRRDSVISNRSEPSDKTSRPTSLLSPPLPPIQPARHVTRPPSRQSTPTQEPAPQAPDSEEDEEEDSDSDLSDNSVATTSTMASAKSSSSKINESQLSNLKKSISQGSEKDITNWLRLLESKSQTFREPHRSRDRSQKLAENLYDKYIDQTNVPKDLETKIINAIYSDIKSRRESHKNHKQKSSSHKK